MNVTNGPKFGLGQRRRNAGAAEGTELLQVLFVQLSAAADAVLSSRSGRPTRYPHTYRLEKRRGEHRDGAGAGRVAVHGGPVAISTPLVSTEMSWPSGAATASNDIALHSHTHISETTLGRGDLKIFKADLMQVELKVSRNLFDNSHLVITSRHKL